VPRGHTDWSRGLEQLALQAGKHQYKEIAYLQVSKHQYNKLAF